MHDEKHKTGQGSWTKGDSRNETFLMRDWIASSSSSISRIRALAAGYREKTSGLVLGRREKLAAFQVSFLGPWGMSMGSEKAPRDPGTLRAFYICAAYSYRLFAGDVLQNVGTAG